MAEDNQAEPDWKALVAKWQGSGLTKAAFCRRNGLVTSVFYRHVKESEKSTSSFAKVKINDSAVDISSSCTIELPSGVRIILNNPSERLLRELIR